MLKGICGSTFYANDRVYVFDVGYGIFIENLGYSEESREDKYKILLGDGDEVVVSSSICFEIVESKMVRTWSLNTHKVVLTYDHSAIVIKLLYLGEPVKVCYDNKRDCEVFKQGDRLHKDWEGRGIEFDVLIDKWLRRLDGEIIPLSEYYHDPYNRWLDSLSERVR